MTDKNEPLVFPGKPEWQEVLHYTHNLHIECTYPAETPFPYAWENIGKGYCYGPAFGHWDIVHAALDAIHTRPVHAERQLLNNMHNQAADGLLPGVIWMSGGEVRWGRTYTHPPVWPVAVDDLARSHNKMDLIKDAYEPLTRQIGWFERSRKAEGEGFYYTDILNHIWESGVDDGIRFNRAATGAFACVDATAHVYQMYAIAATWAEQIGLADEARKLEAQADNLRAFIQTGLFDEETDFFHDIWAVGVPEQRCLAFEGMWPMIVGAASERQAQRVIDNVLLDPQKFLTAHPMPTIAISDPGFELRMWRGPAWNSMTYWVARGCMRYGRHDAARTILGRALDATAEQFRRTGTIWEFYDPQLGNQEELQRKPYTPFNTPCRDYLGHNPLIAMVYLWEACRARIEEQF